MLTTQNTLDITTYATLDDFLAEKNMLHGEFDHEIDLWFLHEIQLSSYNGAIDLSTPWQLNQGNVNEALYQEAIHPQNFVEVFSGGGTGRDVARELGYQNSLHLDGWDALRDKIPVASDFIFSHPPYWDIVDYSKMRGGQSDADDLSNGMSYEEFITKLDLVNQKIYNSLKMNGRHGLLVGDVRKKGAYYSIIKGMTWFGDLEDHLIKEQFNTVSARKQYGRAFIPISHEHLLIFKKNSVWDVAIKFTKDFVRVLREMVNVTWNDLIKAALQALGGQATLTQLYQALEGCKKSANNINWQAKVRQTVQMSKAVNRVAESTYSLL